MSNAICKNCGEHYSEQRKMLGYVTCLDCGSPNAIRTIVPVHKSHYAVISNRQELMQLNPKGHAYG